MNEDAMPAVTCLCPTYGRFERLRDAVACFVLQDYPNKNLFILNDGAPIKVLDAPAPPGALEGGLTGMGLYTTLWNHPGKFETLGHKRQRLLSVYETPLAAHWDDDDLYLPWHLSHCVEALTSSTMSTGPTPTMVKPRGAWWLLGVGDQFLVRGPCHNVFEGQVVFDRRRAIELGGYSRKDSGQARDLMRAFYKAGEFHRFDPWPYISYCYRWGDSLEHVSAAKTMKKFTAQNRDFGDGEHLIPPPDPSYLSTRSTGSTVPAWPLAWAWDRLRPLFERLLHGLELLVERPDIEESPRRSLTENDYAAFKSRLKSYMSDTPYKSYVSTMSTGSPP